MAIEVETFRIESAESTPATEPEWELRIPFFPLALNQNDLDLLNPQTRAQAQNLARIGGVEDQIDTKFVYAMLRTVGFRSAKDGRDQTEWEQSMMRKSDQIVFSDALSMTNRPQDRRTFESRFPHIFPQIRPG